MGPAAKAPKAYTCFRVFRRSTLIETNRPLPNSTMLGDSRLLEGIAAIVNVIPLLK